MTTPEQTPPAGDAGTSIAEYSKTEAGLAEIRARMRDVVYDLTTTKGLDAAKRDRRELVTLRTSLEAQRKALKEPALELTRRIDSEAKRITAAIVELEEPIDAQIRKEEARREAEKLAKIEAERRRIETIQAAIDVYRRAVADCTGMTSAQIAARRNEIAATRFDEVWPAQFAEFGNDAKAARDSAVIALADLQDRVARQEAEAAQIARDRAELEELKRAQAAAAAREEAARRAREEEERRAREAREAEERRQREAAEAQARAAREAEERAAAERRAAEDARLKAEADRLAAERAAFERQQREAEEAERRRREQREAEERAVAEAQRKAEEERQRAERERLAEENAARVAARRHALANTTVTASLLDLLERCEAFICGFEDDPDQDVGPLLGDLRTVIHAYQPVREAA